MIDIVGLIPAAGQAKRLAPLPCSKEIFPLGTMRRAAGETIEYSPKPVGLYLLERMIAAGAQKAFMIINKEKWDIPKYFGSGARFNISIAYLMQENLRGMPFALDQAYPWVKNSRVIFGMPDTIFYPEDAFSTLVASHEAKGAAYTLGLFPTTKPERFGMVAFDDEYKVSYTIDKPAQTDLKYMWGIGCWGPEFSAFMHEFLLGVGKTEREVVLGDIFQAALEEGMDARAVVFESGEYIDIGNLKELNSLVPLFANHEAK